MFSTTKSYALSTIYVSLEIIITRNLNGNGQQSVADVQVKTAYDPVICSRYWKNDDQVLLRHTRTWHNPRLQKINRYGSRAGLMNAIVERVDFFSFCL